MKESKIHNVNSFNPAFSSINIDKKECNVSINNVSIFYTNADQLMNKRNEFFTAVEIYNPDVIGVVEVKPKASRYIVEESELQIENYEMFHNLQDEGRGVVLFIRQKLKPSLCNDITNSFSEKIIVECMISEGKTLLISLIYRRQDLPVSNAEKLNDLFEILAQRKATHKVVIGDFNYPQIDWHTESSTVSNDHIASKFLKASKDSFFYQHQITPTRHRVGQRANTLDLVFTNSEELVSDLKVEAPLGKSDHFSLLITLSVTASKTEKKSKRNFRKMNTTIVKDILGKIDWKKNLEEKNVNDSWNYIKEQINCAIEKSTPMTNSSGKKGKPWMNPETLTVVREKHKQFRKWHKSEEKDEKTIAYKKANNKARKACRKANKAYERKIAEESKKNPKLFYSYANSKMKSKSGIADLTKEDGSKTKTDEEKAELLNKFFQSVFTIENDSQLPYFEDYEYENITEDIDFSIDTIKKLLAKLDKNKAQGPDGIPPSLLSEAAEELAEPIGVLFRKSLESGQLPKDWKTANISPIFKKGNKSAVNNYRPVSLTCILCKTMEKLIRETILNHLLQNGIISPHQHGFVPGKSCITQLLESIDDWTSILEEGGSVDIVYMDFQKAFDSVPHKRLLKKLSACGIGGKILRWVEDFLSERKQTVVINGIRSEERDVTSGIPQGSVLGPLLFVVYINDLPKELKSVAKLFADDTKLYCRSDIDSASENLQQDLDKLNEWSQNWLLRFHPDKCCVLKLGKENNHEYYMGSETRVKLKETTKEKDLGVIVDNQLSFKDHINSCTAKANRIVGLIRRTFDFLSERTFVLLFKSMVRPLLEYGNSVWNPSLKSLMNEVENVQRRATKMLSHLRDKPYSVRLRILKLPCLEHRRNRGTMIETYKYVHGMYNSEKPVFHRATTNQLRGHSLKLQKKSIKTSIRANFLSNRVITKWNSLPESVVNAPSVNSFKNRLDEHWKNLSSIYEPTFRID